MLDLEPYKDRSVAVLGGAGFIGRHLLKLLSAYSDRLVSVGGFSSSSEFATGARQLGGRVTMQLLESLPEKPDVLFHLAGGASVAKSLENPRQDFELTVQSTFEVLEYLRVVNPECRLVYVSSAAVYGGAATDSADRSELRPVSAYGVHKKLAEELCEYYSRRHSLNLAIVRPFSVYGPGLRKQLLWDALQKIDRGAFTFFGTGTEIRDWVYVEDLARLLLYAGFEGIDKGAGIIDAGTGVGVSIKAILMDLFKWYSPDSEPVFLGNDRPGDPKILIAARANENPAARALLSTSLAEGLGRYVEWYRGEMHQC